MMASQGDSQQGSHTNHCQPPIQITASTQQGSHTNHCQPGGGPRQVDHCGGGMGLADVFRSVPCVLALTVAAAAFQLTVMDIELQARLLGVLVGAQLVLIGVFQGLPGPFKQKPTLAAFEVVTSLYCVWLSYRGLLECMEHLFPADFAADEVQSRIYEPTAFAEYANNALGSLALFELAMILVLPELRQWDTVLHHFAVCVVCSFTVYPRPYAPFYSPFYSGLQELSSVALGAVDTFKQFPSLQQSYSGAYLGARFVFAALFVAVRLVVWLWVTYYFWRDLYLLYVNDQVRDWLPVVVLYSLNAFVTFLQLLWGRLVIRNSLRVLGVLEKPKKPDKRS